MVKYYLVLWFTVTAFDLWQMKKESGLRLKISYAFLSALVLALGVFYFKNYYTFSLWNLLFGWIND